MDTFFENARKIFDVACSDTAEETSDFALLVRPDGGLHLIMNSTTPFDAVAENEGARMAYRVTRSSDGVRVIGRNRDRRCVLEDRAGKRSRISELLRDQPLYEINRTRALPLSPL